MEQAQSPAILIAYQIAMKGNASENGDKNKEAGTLMRRIFIESMG